MDKTWPASAVEQRSIEQLVPYASNPRSHSLAQIAQIAASIREWGWTMPILVDEENNVIAGHGRLEAARQLSFNTVPIMVAKGWSEAQKKAYVIADNRLSENASWDDQLLKLELSELDELAFDNCLTGFDAKELDKLLAPPELTKDDYYCDSESGAMFKKFMVPPFSILDSRQGYWQERKRHWLNKGLASDAGRDDHLLYNSKQINITGAGQTSVFDPVLCELMVRWFSPPNGLVLDPFAGGSVRGIVSKLCGRDYIGVDLREEQVQANREQAEKLCPDNPPLWQVGDIASKLNAIVKVSKLI